MSTLTQCCLPTGDVQLLAVVFERNAILRWGEKTAVGKGAAGWPSMRPPVSRSESSPRLHQVHHHWPGGLRRNPRNRPGAQPHLLRTAPKQEQPQLLLQDDLPPGPTRGRENQCQTAAPGAAHCPEQPVLGRGEDSTPGTGAGRIFSLTWEGWDLIWWDPMN